jgi:hypothetical protein
VAIIALAGLCLGALFFLPSGPVMGSLCLTPGFCLPPLEVEYGMAQGLALALLTGLAMYAALLRGPIHYRQWQLRKRLTKQFRQFKDTCIATMMVVADGTADPELRQSLSDPAKFREYFETEISPGPNRWQAFQINLDHMHFEQILWSMEALHDEITLVLNSVEIRCYAPFELRKRLSVAMDTIRVTGQSAEKSRLLANMLWEIFAARNAGLNISQDDLLKKTLACIDWDPAVPFTKSWWRKAPQREPLSAHLM